MEPDFYKKACDLRALHLAFKGQGLCVQSSFNASSALNIEKMDMRLVHEIKHLFV